MNGKSTAYRIVLIQLGISVVLATALALHDPVMAYTAFVGGLINVLANLYVAVHVFHRGVRPARSVLRGFYIAEFMKILITAALFALALVVFNLSFLPLLLGYGITLAAFWLALLPVGPFRLGIHA